MEVDDASCSLPGDSSLVLSGNTIVAQNTYTFEKVETINVRDTIVGQFAGVLTSSDIFIFEEGGAFTHTKTDNDDPKCSNGTAKGTYVWNPVTSLIDVSLTSDETTSGGTKPSCSIPGLHLITVVENGLFVDDRLFFHTME